jgi:hypothetical protein
MNRMKNIAGDQSGFYPPSLRLKAKKFIAENGTPAEKKILQRTAPRNVARLGDSKVQRIGEYNENNNSLDSLGNLF